MFNWLFKRKQSDINKLQFEANRQASDLGHKLNDFKVWAFFKDTAKANCRWCSADVIVSLDPEGKPMDGSALNVQCATKNRCVQRNV